MAAEGFGPLLQRDYWSVIRNARLRPSEIVDLVANHLSEFAPVELCEFQNDRVEIGQRIEIHIPVAIRCEVEVLRRDACSFTLGTVKGHPEAGRITFGAYRNDRGDVIFHIRSRARAGNGPFFAAFVTMGEAMQTNTWTEFVNRVALRAGEGPLGVIHADTVELPEPEAALDADREESTPTFLAEAD